MQAADLFEQGVRPVRVAEVLGVTRQAAGLWHRAWREGGAEALRSKETGNNAYLSDEQEQELDGLLKAGPMACRAQGAPNMTLPRGAWIRRDFISSLRTQRLRMPRGSCSARNGGCRDGVAPR